MPPKSRSRKTIYSAKQLAELVCDESDSDDDFDCPVDHVRSEDSDASVIAQLMSSKVVTFFL